MKNEISGKKRLVLTFVIFSLFIALAFSAAMGKPPKQKDDDWNILTNPPHMFSIPEGNVGIGTTTPSEKLEVIGNISATSYYGDGSSLTGVVGTESDPVFIASAANGITLEDIGYWNTAYGWGDHSLVGYLTGETDPIYSSAPVSEITSGDISNWNTAFGWGDHASAGYDTTPDSWTGTGNVYTTSSNVGIGTTDPNAKFDVEDGAVLFSGTTGAVPVSGSGRRLMWIPQYGAFRAGQVSGNQWDSENMGSYSIALGKDVTSSGFSSMAMGLETIASNASSTAMGQRTTASGIASTAMGMKTEASGYDSTAIGHSIKVDGDFSVGIGLSNTPYTVSDRNVLSIMGGIVGIGTTNPSSHLEVDGIIHSSRVGFKFPDGTFQSTAFTGEGNTLDQAYDQGGLGAG